jgi:hypothetical protein
MLLLLLRQMVEVAVDSASLIACKLQKSSSFLIKFRLSRGRGGDVWSFVELLEKDEIDRFLCRTLNLYQFSKSESVPLRY